MRRDRERGRGACFDEVEGSGDEEEEDSESEEGRRGTRCWVVDLILLLDCWRDLFEVVVLLLVLVRVIVAEPKAITPAE